jgi:GH25 family lysozyme M1 (1,4-beta-N-acetylmuramidase)
MNNFNDFLAVVNGLPSGTNVVVTYEWCTSKGLIVNPNMMKDWGKKFSAGVKAGQYGCVRNTNTSPSQGSASHKKTNNLCVYTKS